MLHEQVWGFPSCHHPASSEHKHPTPDHSQALVCMTLVWRARDNSLAISKRRMACLSPKAPKLRRLNNQHYMAPRLGVPVSPERSWRLISELPALTRREAAGESDWDRKSVYTHHHSALARPKTFLERPSHTIDIFLLFHLLTEPGVTLVSVNECWEERMWKPEWWGLAQSQRTSNQSRWVLGRWLASLSSHRRHPAGRDWG